MPRSRRWTWAVQRIHEAPEQAFAFVGELCAVRCDHTGQNVDRFLDPAKASSSFQISRLSNSSRPGSRRTGAACSHAIAVCDAGSVLMKFCMSLSNAMFLSSEAGCPVVMTLWVTRSQRSHDGRNACAGGCASGAGAGSGASEPRSRIPPALAAQRRGITRYCRNGAKRSGGPGGVGAVRTCGTMRHHDGLIILPLPRLSSAVAADLKLAIRGEIRAARVSFPKAMRSLLKSECSGTITVEGMPRSAQRRRRRFAACPPSTSLSRAMTSRARSWGGSKAPRLPADRAAAA